MADERFAGCSRRAVREVGATVLEGLGVLVESSKRQCGFRRILQDRARAAKRRRVSKMTYFPAYFTERHGLVEDSKTVAPDAGDRRNGFAGGQRFAENERPAVVRFVRPADPRRSKPKNYELRTKNNSLVLIRL